MMGDGIYRTAVDGEEMPEAYEGDRPYIFMCYAHADRGTVLPIIRVLAGDGYRVWYDNGIQPATDFPEYIADHIHDCACFVMFVSCAFRASDWCKREVNYAIDCGNVILPVYLEDVELTRGLKLGLGTVQALFWYRCESDEVFYRKLFETRALDCCITDEGKERRQSKNLLVQKARRVLDAGECGREDFEGVLEDLSTLFGSLPTRDREVEQIIQELEERIAREGEKDTPSPTTAGHTPEKSGDGVAKHREEDVERHSSSAGDGEVKPTEVLGDLGGQIPAVEQKRDDRRHEVPPIANEVACGISEHTRPERVLVTGQKVKDSELPEKTRHSVVAKAVLAIAVVVMIAVIARYTSQPISGLEKNTQQPIDTVAAEDAGVDAQDNDSVQYNALVDGVLPKSVLNDYSWDELKQLATAIAQVPDDEWLSIAKTYNLVDNDDKLQGDVKTLALNDDTMTGVRILGFRHDELVGGGKAGISFEFSDVPITHRMNEFWINEGGWERSEMREWLDSEFLSSLPSELQSRIETVRKETNNVGEVRSEDDTSVVTPKSDRLWLISVAEVWGHVDAVWSSATYDAEGSQYKLYADKGVSTSSYGFCRKCEEDGADSWWWLRSPNVNGTGRFQRVGRDGNWGSSLADHELGVSPGFCF